MKGLSVPVLEVIILFSPPVGGWLDLFVFLWSDSLAPIVSFCCGSKARSCHHPIMPFLPFNCWVNQKRRHSQGGITARRFMDRVSPSLETEGLNCKVDPCSLADQPFHIIHLGHRNKGKIALCIQDIFFSIISNHNFWKRKRSQGPLLIYLFIISLISRSLRSASRVKYPNTLIYPQPLCRNLATVQTIIQ